MHQGQVVGDTGGTRLAGRSMVATTLAAAPFPIRPIEPAPCSRACPAGINVKAYVSLIAEGRFAEALEVVRRHCPLPSVCGRVCPAPCEAVCLRGDVDDPLAIRALKRFVTEQGSSAVLPDRTLPPSRGEPVAVIGSGPAGLTAAHDLRLAGFPVTVFEAERRPGGMLRYGIAEYRLPREVLDEEIGILCATGIDVRTEHRFESFDEVTALLQDGFAAVLLAVGAQRGRVLGIDGEEQPAVEDALSFLRRVNSGDRSPVDGTVVVVGGGSTAVEAARTARRLGAARVVIAYRRSRAEMPAGREEVELAEEEGIELRLQSMPQRIVDGTGTSLECVETALGAPDDSGRARPVPIPGSEFVIEADRVLAAVGQELDDALGGGDAGPALDRGLLRADPATLMTPTWGVFAAGDAVTGPATVIDAIATGHRAAAAISSYLDTGFPQLPAPPDAPTAEYQVNGAPPHPAARRSPEIRLPSAGHEFEETEQPYSEADAVAEAQRCLRCGPCSECELCAPTCGRRHALVADAGEAPFGELRMPESLALALDGRISAVLSGGDSFESADISLQPMRVTLDEAACRGCARCLDVCQFDAIAAGDPTTSPVAVDPSRCRGCGLCIAVCPTGALEATALSRTWWRRWIDMVAEREEGVELVLTCATRAVPAVDWDRLVVPFRCVGQVTAGMVLQACGAGARRVVIDGCGSDCRFGSGGRMAGEAAGLARQILRWIGDDESQIEVGRARTPVGAGRQLGGESQ